LGSHRGASFIMSAAASAAPPFGSSFAITLLASILAALALNGYCWATPPVADRSSTAEDSPEDAIVRAGPLLAVPGDNPRQRSRALAEYRSAVMKLLPILQEKLVAADAADERKLFHRQEFSEVTPVERSWRRASGLRRDGLGLPVVGRIAQSAVT